ncbi:Serine/threonine-protein kinase pknB [Actinomyces bovis]|uniref:non-specific serine/threonine protein kinase n=1 Tax=Actinomyces bovis TaxID=1658 RepID=A0ABY1VR03_9ACTO|nr:Stk1 family PASTA domain-containing Ser/Thr kinase [Actinomyces bovis]SPT54384.1 Serine/threonine-protein kinase pknB [Actinomyces bovis]VEG56067.1 Serine/threonine-protein kinase pknB [Actinomyces israelii]
MTEHFPRILAGRYEIRDLIGRGGMAEVRLGYDTRLSRTIAVKLLRADIADDETFQARFRREAQSAAGLNHPAIVAVYDSGEEPMTQPDGTVRSVPYIVMEYVEGHTVRELLGEGEAVPIEEAVEITVGVLNALEYSHRAGIVHRDIKPGNIMLTSTGDVKVMDFGIARAIEDSAATVTQTHSVVGTAQYLSPEQARGELVDARSDLYSTGCLLYELLTGQPPFQGDSAVAIAYQHVRELAKPPSSLAADVPEALDRVVLKALAKARDDRYQDAAHMRSDLLAASQGLAVVAPAVDAWSQQTTFIPAQSQLVNPSPAPAPPSGQSSESAEEEPHRSNTWVWWLVGGLVLLAALIGGLYAAGAVGGSASHTPTPVVTAAPVPDVAGKSEAEAKAAIEAAGLVFKRGDDVASDTVDPGLAVSTDPGSGTNMVLGQTVTVHFSSGSAMVTVPDVKGKSQSEARSLLQAAGLVVGDVTTEDAAGFDAGEVIRTTPVAGTSVKRGATISLVVASGKVTVPTVVGLKLSEAEEALRAAGLSYKIVTEKTTDPAQVDTVKSVDPLEGAAVNAGKDQVTVTAWVADQVDVPDVKGQTQAQATAALRAAGLGEVTVTEVEAQSPAEAGKIVSQTPEAGQKAMRNTPVSISVGKSAAPTPAPTQKASKKSE